MSDPETREAYEAKFHGAEKVSGFGITGVKTHMPCPGCAEPEWFVCRVIDVEDEMQDEHVCAHCSRGFRAIVKRRGVGDVSFEFVQTRGPDLPAYLPPMRRLP